MPKKPSTQWADAHIVRTYGRFNAEDPRLSDFLPRIALNDLDDLEVLGKWERFLRSKRVPYAVTRHPGDASAPEILKLWKAVEVENWDEADDGEPIRFKRPMRVEEVDGTIGTIERR
ncbi:MAG: hypothetical protein P1V51_19960 [Deltaproteobacteria bacterium]|nr:hypothetical protein [Deltaproteobacteria bacterium]